MLKVRLLLTTCCLLSITIAFTAHAKEATPKTPKASAPTPKASVGYQGPSVVVATPDGSKLLVVCEDANRIAILDAEGKPVDSIDVPPVPTGLAISPDGKTLYVTCANPLGQVVVIDLASKKVVASLPAGQGAISPVISPDGKTLYVCNRFNDDVSFIDLTPGKEKELRRVRVTREPYAAVITKDGKTLYVGNHVPLDPATDEWVASNITLIDTASGETKTIRLPNGVTDIRGICITPDGRYVLTTHILARYRMPTTQLERGWINTNAFSIIDTEKQAFVNSILLDDVDKGAANPWGVACSPDGKKLVITHAGTHEVSVIEWPKLLSRLRTLEDKAEDKDPEEYYGSAKVATDVPNDLSFLVGLRKRVKLPGNGPRGIAFLGKKAAVALYFSDTMALLNPSTRNVKRSIKITPLGPEPVLTEVRRGEILFNDGTICFQQWLSCASCHPDSRTDGLNWDLMNDGLGNPKNVRSMLLTHKTPPVMSTGVRPDAETAVRAGIRYILFAVRPEEESLAIDAYLKQLTPMPSPHLVDGKLSESAERGKKIFFGKRSGCSECHTGPLYTDGKLHNVDSKGPIDRREKFITSTLIECWRTAPYLHDGRYTTIGDLLQKGLHGEVLVDLSKLTDQETKDLIEFVKSL